MFQKKNLYLGIAAFVLPVLAHAALPYGMAGCGLGSSLMGADGNQILAYTTNGVAYSQIFGLTSGTSNCVEDTQANAYNAQKHFMAENFENLSKEIAQGDGETLRAFSGTLGCSKESYQEFATLMRNSYSKIFSAPGSVAALDEVHNQLKNNTELSQKCPLNS